MLNRVFIVVVFTETQLGFPEFIDDNRRWIVVDGFHNGDVAFYGNLEQAEELRRVMSRFDLVKDGLLRIRIDECDRDELKEDYPNLKINYFYPEGLANGETSDLPALPHHQVEEFLFPADQSAVRTTRLRQPLLEEPMITVDFLNF